MKNEDVYLYQIPQSESLDWLLGAADFKLHRCSNRSNTGECLFTLSTAKLFVQACTKVDVDVIYNDFDDEETPKRIVWLVNFICSLENFITCIDANYRRELSVVGYDKN